MKRTRVALVLGLALAACGGSSKSEAPAAPAPATAAPAPAGGLELGELTLFQGSVPVFKLHATGATEMAVKDNGKDAWKPGPTFKADGTVEENGVAKAKINADGSVTGIGTTDKIDMKVDADKASIPMDKGTLEISLGADGKFGISGIPQTVPADQLPRVEGADTPGKRRTALILVAITLTMSDTPAPAPAAAVQQPTK